MACSSCGRKFSKLRRSNVRIVGGVVQSPKKNVIKRTVTQTPTTQPSVNNEGEN